MSGLNEIVDYLTMKKNIMEEEVNFLGNAYLKKDGQSSIPVLERTVKYALLHELIEEIKYLSLEPEPKETPQEEPEDAPVPDSLFYHIKSAFAYMGYYVHITGNIDPTKVPYELDRCYVVATIKSELLDHDVKLCVKVDNIYNEKEVEQARDKVVSLAHRYIRLWLTAEYGKKQ